MTNIIGEFRNTIESSAAQLAKISEEESQRTRGSGKWSKREILGHLIDSAANNHQRFVRAQLTPSLSFPGYEQERWVAIQQYQEAAWSELCTLWKCYNVHLLHVAARIPEDFLDRSCSIGSGNPVTLRFLLTDYVAHLQHHLREILASHLE